MRRMLKLRSIMLVCLCAVTIFIAAYPCSTIYALEEGSSIVSDSVNTAGFKVFDRLYQDNKNIVFSPVSFNTALAMLMHGANGDTKKQISDFLYDGIKVQDTHLLYETYLKELTDWYKHQPPIATTPPDPRFGVIKTMNDMIYERRPHLDIFNSAWIGKDAIINAGFSNISKSYYYADIFSDIDFKSQKTVTSINEWIKKATNGKIKNSIEKLNSPNNGVAIFSALSVADHWNVSYTIVNNQDFYLNENDIIKTAMLVSAGGVGYYDNSEFQAVKLNLQKNELILVLPKDSIAKNKLTVEKYNELADALENEDSKFADIKLKFPKFELKQNCDLTKAIKELGVTDAFDISKANFNNMLEDSSQAMFLDSINQQCTFLVDENGIKGAAVTIVYGSGSNRRGIPEEVIFNKPFYYILNNRDTNSIMFMGCLFNPSQN